MQRQLKQAIEDVKIKQYLGELIEKVDKFEKYLCSSTDAYDCMEEDLVNTLDEVTKLLKDAKEEL